MPCEQEKKKQISPKEPCMHDVFSLLRFTSPRFCSEFIVLEDAYQNLLLNFIYFKTQYSYFPTMP